MCDAFSCALAAPPARYCTDNGAMVAWNGVEKLRRAARADADADAVGAAVAVAVAPEDAVLGFDISARADFGEDVSADVADRGIKCAWVNILR